MQTNVQRNLWRLFFILTSLFFVLLLVSLYLRYSEAREKRLSQLCYAQETLWRGIAIFKNYETLIDGTRHFIKKKKLTQQQKREFEEYLKNLVRSDELILGFRISDKNGNSVFLNSSLHPHSAAHNLKKSAITREDFLKTLQSPRMFIGRPYQLETGEWILPLRKALYNDAKDKVWVVTIVLDLKKFIAAFPHNHNKIFLSILLKDPTWMRIFRSHTPPQEYERYFGKPLTKEQFKYLFNALKKVGLTVDDLRKTTKPKLFEFDFVDIKNNKATLYSCIQYNRNYKLWSVVVLIKQQLFDNLVPILVNYLLTFFAIIAVFYFLFKRIASLEKKRFDELHHQATHDPLTNLPNRYYMEEIAQEWIEENERFCILFLDLDNFKNINDAMGHPTGDKLLIAVARRIKATLPKEAVLIRHGGGRIYCLLPF